MGDRSTGRNALPKGLPDILDRTEALLSANPEIGRRGRVAGARESVLPDTSCVVTHRLREAVEILAVMHGAREWPASFD